MSHKSLIYNPDYQEIVANIVDYIDVNPHSRNIISDCLRAASNIFGIDVVNDLIEEFDLEKKGWSKIHSEESSQMNVYNINGELLKTISFDDFVGADLGNVDLRNANFENADLRIVNFDDVNLQGSCLCGSDLTHASMVNANLNTADLNKACLNGANLNNAVLLDANLSEAILSKSFLWDARLEYSNLNFADLNCASLKRASLKHASLYKANFNGADLCGTNFTGANLQNANFQDAILAESNLENTNLEGVNLQGTDLRYVKGDGQKIKTLYLYWTVVIAAEWDIMAIGCEQHSIPEWMGFTDEEISKMHKNALKWWKEHKQEIARCIRVGREADEPPVTMRNEMEHGVRGQIEET